VTPGLAWALAVAAVYRRITANGYSPYGLPWAGCGDGYRFAQRHPTRPADATILRRPTCAIPPVGARPAREIAGRAREDHGADGYRFAQRHPTGLHPVGAIHPRSGRQAGGLSSARPFPLSHSAARTPGPGAGEVVRHRACGGRR